MGTPELLLPDLLSERTVALAGGARAAVVSALSGLGARLVSLGGGVNALAHELDAEAWAAEHSPVHALVYDAAAVFADGGAAGLRAAVDDGWSAIHAVATTAFIPTGRGAAIVLIAPREAAGAHATAVRAALENTARTLSIEWARFAVTTTAITPGASTSDADIATLVAFLVSPAGAYYSGCRFELGAVGSVTTGRAPSADPG
jgi:hypothetical protein